MLLMLAAHAGAADKPAAIDKDLTQRWALFDKYCMKCHNNDDYNGMGTTVVGILASGSQVAVGHVGHRDHALAVEPPGHAARADPGERDREGLRRPVEQAPL